MTDPDRCTLRQEPPPTGKRVSLRTLITGALILFAVVVVAALSARRYLLTDRSEPATTGDLLALVDPDKHSIRGHWRFEGAELVSPDQAGALLLLPSHPPDEYTLEIVARSEKVGSAVIGNGNHR